MQAGLEAFRCNPSAPFVLVEDGYAVTRSQRQDSQRREIHCVEVTLQAEKRAAGAG